MGAGEKIFSFGEFTLDPGEEVLYCGSEPVALTPKAFQMLRFLIENPGRSVDKEELLNEVWADSFVEQGNIAFTVNRLRRALGDNKDQPRFIETVPRILKGHGVVHRRKVPLLRELHRRQQHALEMADRHQHVGESCRSRKR